VRTDVSLGRTPDGRRIEVSGVVDAAPAAAWDLLVDTDRWPDWGPSVTAVDCPDRRIREGSTGRVRLPGGLRVPFEVTTLDERRRRWTWAVARIPATGHRVDPVAGRRSREPEPGREAEPGREPDPASDPAASDDDRGPGGGASDRCRVVFEVPVLAGGYVPVCRRALGRIEDCLVG
jgi:hypothetical protein